MKAEHITLELELPEKRNPNLSTQPIGHGDAVALDEPIASLETDKVSVDVLTTDYNNQLGCLQWEVGGGASAGAPSRPVPSTRCAARRHRPQPTRCPATMSLVRFATVADRRCRRPQCPNARGAR